MCGGRGSREIDIDLQATDVDQLLEAGRAAFAEISRKMPEANIRPQPELELAQPELRLLPDDRSIAEHGWSRSGVATLVRGYGGGAFLGHSFGGDRRLDVILRGPEWHVPEDLMSMPVATPSG